ncbi:33120_t:CDS:2, partial [Racocetra persica]
YQPIPESINPTKSKNDCQSLIKSENDDDEKSSDLEYDIAESDEENNQDTDCKVKSRNLDNSEDVISDPIQELFAHIL